VKEGSKVVIFLWNSKGVILYVLVWYVFVCFCSYNEWRLELLSKSGVKAP